MDKNHPYARYQGLPEWENIDKAISQLISNNDLIEKTSRPYIIGYIIKALDKGGLLKNSNN